MGPESVRELEIDPIQQVSHNTYIPVLPTTGQTQLKRICFAPYSTAMVFDALLTAALEALYQVRPGRGRNAAVDETWMKHPRRLVLTK